MNVKAGQKAIIVDPLDMHKGKIVLVLEFLGHCTFAEGPDRHDVWLVESLGSPFTWPGLHEPCMTAACEDKGLRPVQDLPDEHVTTDEDIEIAA